MITRESYFKLRISRYICKIKKKKKRPYSSIYFKEKDKYSVKSVCYFSCKIESGLERRILFHSFLQHITERHVLMHLLLPPHCCKKLLRNHPQSLYRCCPYLHQALIFKFSLRHPRLSRSVDFQFRPF